MFVFVDEAGDTGLKIDRGSSRFFTIALILLMDDEEMDGCDRRINELRVELGKQADFEFHFHDNSLKVREAFLKAVTPFGFVYYAFVLNKDPEKIYGDAFKSKESFYKIVAKFVFENARPHLKDAYVVIDKSGSREFQGALARYVRGAINAPGDRAIRKFRAERSCQNNLLQLADYIASICHRKATGKADADAYYRYISLKEIQFRKWPQ